MKKRNFVLRGFNAFTLAERICGSAGAKPQAGETSQYFPSPLAKFRTADKLVSESRNHGSGSEVMTGASAKEFQDAGEGLGVRGNKAFTLAEVLITLVIIGVIGALTVPALIQNTQKQEYVSALKKAYSTLSQAAQQIITEEGTPKCDAGGWGCSNSDVFEKFRKYLNSAKECPIGKSVCFYKPRSSLGTNRNDWTWGGTGIYSKLILADGMQLAVNYVSSSCEFNNFWNNGSNDVCADISVDINGEKGPNIIGRDVFSFVLKENGLYPGGCDTGKCPDKTQRGYDCACKVLTEGAMNY